MSLLPSFLAWPKGARKGVGVQPPAPSALLGQQDAVFGGSTARLVITKQLECNAMTLITPFPVTALESLVRIFSGFNCHKFSFSSDMVPGRIDPSTGKMPLEADDQARVDEAIRESGSDATGNRILVLNPADSQKLGPGTVICTILNRVIGLHPQYSQYIRAVAEIFPSTRVWYLRHASHSVTEYRQWLLVWLELGLSIPKFELPDRDDNDTVREGATSLQCVPRNGGEKNYLEYIYKVPRMRTTCIYGLIYVIVGNLSGNAVALGIYILQAAGIEENDPLVRGLAVISLTVACLLHASWRKGGIVVNNVLAVMKVLVLVAIIVIGFAASAGASFGHGPVHGETIDPKTQGKTSNFDTQTSFAFARSDPAGYSEALLYVTYTFKGYEQPFYLCVVSFDQRLNEKLDMATVFFREVFGNDVAPRVMSGIIALSIFGNMVVMTFTASRAVKQEIAKEGVLPFSLFFASSSTTPWARFRRRFFPSSVTNDRLEQSPSAALFLHWIFSVVMIAATSSAEPGVAYSVLASLYSYAIILLIGFFVAGGLLYLRFFSDEHHTWTRKSGFKPWGGPTAAIIYTLVCAFLLCAAYVPPSSESPYAKANTGVAWYIVPTAGLASAILGFLYYIGFKYVYPPLVKDGKVLIVDREALIVREHGEYVQALEHVDANWERRTGPGSNEGEEEMQRVEVLTK
ncbi:MAG: hypothetical protein Q9208_001588 [Pyrenodesmia sp. 3 TL-2023]